MARRPRESRGASPSGGLYRKALIFHRLTLAQASAEAEGNGKGISPEERAEITSRLEKTLAETRIQISPQALAYTAKRRGALLPVMSNVAIFAAFVLVGLFIFRLLNHQEQYIASGQANLQGAENKLIAALKKETEQELRDRDQAILDAQKKLQALSEQQQQLRDQSDSAIKAKQQALTADFEAKLSQEKANLQKQGLSAAVEAQRLRDFQEARQRELDRELAAARQQADAQLAAQQKSLAALGSQYQNDLDTARQQREQIQNDSLKKEADLRNQYAQGLQAAQTAKAAVAEELARLRAQREKEQLVLDQILAGYARVNTALQQQDLAEARNGLDALRAYLDDPSVASLPTIQKRRPVELFLIDSLADLVRTRKSAPSADTASLEEAGAQLRSVADLVARGDALSKAGNPSGAREAYLQAMGVIPSVNRGYLALDELRPAAPADPAAAEAVAQLRSVADFVGRGEALSKAGNPSAAREAYLQAMRVIPSVNRGYLALDEMRSPADQQPSLDALAGLQKANLFYQAGNFQGSLSQYRQAVGLLLSNEKLADQLTDNVMNAGYRVLSVDDLAALARLRTDAEKRQAVVRRLQQLRSQYLAYAAFAPKSSDLAEAQSLAGLLQAKILLLQILDSDPVRSQHPQLAADIQRYFAALEQQGRAAGRKAAMDDISSVLGVAGASASAGSSPSSSGSAPDPLVALLDRLVQILSGQ